MNRTILWSVLALAGLAGVRPPLLPGAPAAHAAETPEQKLKALIDEYNAKMAEVNEGIRKAPTDDEKLKIWNSRPGKDWASKFKSVAEEAKGTETAAQGWMWVLKLDPDNKKQCQETIDLLLAEHMTSPALGELPGMLSPYRFSEDFVVERLRALVAESPHDQVRAGALYTLGTTLLDSRDPAKKAEGRDCMTAVQTEYGKLAYGNGTYATAAERYLFELDKLQIGMVAPDFQATDENGVQWKLSDYKGKVVVVDFWGIW